MFRQVFDWLLNKGIVGATLLINLIAYAILAVAMVILNWFHKHH